MLKLTASLRNLFGTHGEIPAKTVNSPLFITGCMRSGTTYLVDQLTSHPQLLKIGSELNDIWTEIGGASIIGKCEHKSKADADPFYTYQMGHYFFQFIEESKTAKRHLMRANVKSSRKLGRFKYDWENIIPVNKSPHLLNKIGYVNGLFPKSKIIFIVRDIFAHSASMKVHFDKDYQTDSKVRVFPKDELSCWSSIWLDDKKQQYDESMAYPPNFELIPKMWLRLNRLAFESLKEIDPDQYMVICYEDLIRKQEENFKAVFQFLDLEKAHFPDEKRIEQVNITYKNTTTKGNPLDKWKKTLSEEEVKAIDRAIQAQQADYDFIQRELKRLKIN